MYLRYIQKESPSEWKKLFAQADKVAFNVKYMFQERVDIAKEKFRASVDTSTPDDEKATSMTRKLVEEAIKVCSAVGS